MKHLDRLSFIRVFQKEYGFSDKQLQLITGGELDKFTPTVYAYGCLKKIINNTTDYDILKHHYDKLKNGGVDTTPIESFQYRFTSYFLDYFHGRDATINHRLDGCDVHLNNLSVSFTYYKNIHINIVKGDDVKVLKFYDHEVDSQELTLYIFSELARDGAHILSQFDLWSDEDYYDDNRVLRKTVQVVMSKDMDKLSYGERCKLFSQVFRIIASFHEQLGFKGKTWDLLVVDDKKSMYSCWDEPLYVVYTEGSVMLNDAKYFKYANTFTFDKISAEHLYGIYDICDVYSIQSLDNNKKIN